MTLPLHSGHTHVLPMGKSLPSHSHTISQAPIFDQFGFRINPILQEDLEEGEVLCDICTGYGYVIDPTWGKMVCKKCQGLAKLDWIERIVGKKEPEISGYSGYSATSGYTGVWVDWL